MLVRETNKYMQCQVVAHTVGKMKQYEGGGLIGEGFLEEVVIVSGPKGGEGGNS